MTMPLLLVPDQYNPLWPKSLSISPPVEDWLDDDTEEGVNGILRRDWESFGSGSTTPPPSKGSVPQVDMAEIRGTGGSALSDSYLPAAEKLKSSFDSMQALDAKIQPLVKGLADKREAAQKEMETLILDLSTQASQPPAYGQDMNTRILSYANDGVQQARGIMEDLLNDVQSASGSIGNAAGDLADIEKKLADLTNIVNQLQAGQGKTPPSGPSWPWDPTSNPFTPETPAVPSAPSDPTSNDVSGQIQKAIDNLQTSLGNQPVSPTTDQTPPSTGVNNQGAAPGANGLDSPLGSMDPSSMILPTLLSQAMQQRSEADPGLNGPREQAVPPPNFDRSPQLAAAAPNVAAPPGPNQSVKPVSDSQAPAPATPAQAPSTTQPGGGPSASTPPPGPDGLIPFPFPDGRTQRVLPVVFQALHAAFSGNPDVTDAQKAYAATSAKWTDSKHIGDPVDPSQLMTGCVATWDNHTAIAVVWPDNGGSIDVIVDGNLQPFAPQMSNATGDFGNFAGFVRPHGVGQAADQSTTAMPSDPSVPVDQASAALGSAVPAVPAIG
ncbi:hypothetical protein [Nocardia sp. CDC160]|uniref:hypothetical protein n=1 Tax=Nocardia sp. CDC160 TaxID=3112166 RepID=UPI002DB9366B|nr:hypothetical protein [Nocardia sp. CDC160]MEC3920199.1 hypothetical protein [Nocardia sp. CDC160]